MSEKKENDSDNDADTIVIQALEIACVRPEPGDTVIINLRQQFHDDEFQRIGRMLNESVSQILGCRCLVLNSTEGIDLGLVKL